MPSTAMSRPATFANASVASLAIAASAGAPVPLYTVFQDEDGLAASAVTSSYVAYILVAALTLLSCGRISDHIGRRPVGALALVVSVLGCWMFTQVDSTAWLLSSRAVQGVGTALGMSALGAYILDLRTPRTTVLAALITSASPTVGVALGAIGSGVLVEFAPHPRTLVFVVLATVCGICAVLLLVSEEVVSAIPGLAASLVPRVAVPAGMMPLFVGASTSFIAAWALGGFYQSLGPSFTAHELHNDNHVLAGGVVACLVGMTVFGGPMTARMSPRSATMTGLAAMVAGVAGGLVLLHAGATVPFLLATAVAGVGFGAACAGSMRGLVNRVRAADGAGLLSAVYLVGYVGAGIPNLAAGFLVPRVGLWAVVVGYGGVIVALSAIAALVSGGHHRARSRSISRSAASETPCGTPGRCSTP